MLCFSGPVWSVWDSLSALAGLSQASPVTVRLENVALGMTGRTAQSARWSQAAPFPRALSPGVVTSQSLVSLHTAGTPK